MVFPDLDGEMLEAARSVFFDAMNTHGFKFNPNPPHEQIISDEEIHDFIDNGTVMMDLSTSNWKAHMLVDWVRCFWEKGGFWHRYQDSAALFPNKSPAILYMLNHFLSLNLDGDFCVSNRCPYGDESALNNSYLQGLVELFRNRRTDFSTFVAPIEDGYSVMSDARGILVTGAGRSFDASRLHMYGNVKQQLELIIKLCELASDENTTYRTES